MSLDQQVPTVGPLNANQLTSLINQELAELYRRSLAVVGSPAGTNNYTGSIPLSRPIEDGNGLIFRVPNTNTGPCDLNGISIVTPTGAAIQSGQLFAGMEIVMIRNQASNTYRVHTPLTGGSAPILRVYATPGTFTWTRPAGLRAVKVRVQAAGGAGGSSTSVAAPSGMGAGGGSGSYGEIVIPAALLPSSVSITVGAGAPAPTATNSGTAGGNSSFGSFVITNGGQGGSISNVAVNGANGGSIGSGGDVNLPGWPGSSNGYDTASLIGGAGGNSPFGGAGGKEIITGNTAGVSGVLGGGGGGGRSTSALGGVSGGAGGNGIVTVEEIY